MSKPKVNTENINKVLKDNSTLFLYLGLGIAGLIIVKQLLNTLKSAGATLAGEQQKKQAESKQTTETKEDLNKLRQQGVKPNYSSTQYSAWADSLYQMIVNGWTEDEEGTYSVMRRLKNDADYIELTKAYGYRRLLFSTTYANLAATIRKYFNDREVAVINNIFQSKGMTVRI